MRSYTPMQTQIAPQSAARNAYAPMETQNPFASVYFDPKFAGGDFPKPLGTSSMRTQIQQPPPATASLSPLSSEAPRKLKKRPPSACEKHLGGRGTAIMLFAWASVTMAVCGYVLWALIQTALQDEFAIVSRLAWDSGYVSFLALVITISVLVGFGMLLAGSACGVGAIEDVKHMRAVMAASGCLGFVIIAFVVGSVAIVMVYNPLLRRTANVVCQETDVWGCNGAKAVAGATGRRLGPGDNALAFEQTMKSEMGFTTQESLCGFLERLCEAPRTFNASTACVCSGNWDIAPKAPPSDRLLRRRLAPRGDDPWRGTMGAFCREWGAEVAHGIEGAWCFATPGQQCANSEKANWTSSQGEPLIISTGSCINTPDSRSQIVLVGLDLTMGTFPLAGSAGVVLIVLAICLLLLIQYPSHDTLLHLHEVQDHNVQYSHAPVPAAYTLEQRFEDAQREAMRKLHDQTPGEMKLMLWGFYRQATQGDCTGERPGLWSRKEDQQKYDYWARHTGLTREQAIEGYVRTVGMLT